MASSLRETGSGRFRQYSPMTLTLVVVVLLAVALLPSALNIPQSNPNTVPEYAPVPPDEESQTSEEGNLAALGQSSGSSLSRSGELQAQPIPAASAQRRSGKRCVGNPPRQTEDPLSPPCVPFFEGDNGGATYLGVSGNEIQVLYYTLGGRMEIFGESRTDSSPCNTYHDLRQPPPPNEHVRSRLLRAYQSYFNNRYQTYNRSVRVWVYYSCAGGSEEARRSDAAGNIDKVKPFAVMNRTVANAMAYSEAMARRGVLTFLGGPGNIIPSGGFVDSVYQGYPGLIWGYDPPVEPRARSFVNYACSKVLPHHVSFSGNAEWNNNGTQRRLGLLHLQNQNFPQLRRYADVIKAGIEDCGGNFGNRVRTHPFEVAGTQTGCGTDPYWTRNMAFFRQEEVTTIIWAGGAETCQSGAAASIAYFPEIVFAGDNVIEATIVGQFQEQSFWRNAWGLATYTRADVLQERQCYLAAKEADPSMSTTDIYNIGCDLYDQMRQLFTGIQVSGPRLHPRPLDRGFHAIPAHTSTDPRYPACYYNPADYTCVKDQVVEYWDPSGRSPEFSASGCMRLVEGGRRYLSDQWPKEDVPVRRAGSSDPCNPQNAAL